MERRPNVALQRLASGELGATAVLMTGGRDAPGATVGSA
jgi:hypothetical protein